MNVVSDRGIAFETWVFNENVYFYAIMIDRRDDAKFSIRHTAGRGDNSTS